jgi:hypothetical protein
MEKIEIGHVKTSHRFRNGVDQTMRIHNRKQKEIIINQVMNRPKGVRITDIIKLYGISPVIYHSWTRKRKEILNSIIHESKSIPTTSPIEIKKIIVEVEITEVNDLFKMLKELCKIEGVKSVSS